MFETKRNFVRALGALVARRALSHAGAQALLAAGLVASSGCSLLITPDNTQCQQQSDCAQLFGDGTELVCVANFCVAPTCQVDADCSALGGAYADKVCVERACVDPAPTSDEPPEWLCLDEPAPAPTAPGPFQVKFAVQDVVSMGPLAGVQARLCRKLDNNCDTPDTTATSDETGNISLSVAKSFSGYITLTRDDLVPTYYFFDSAVDRDMELEPVSLMVPLIMAIQVQMTGAPSRADRGIALITAQDCTGIGVEGISFSSADADQESVLWYSSGGLPSKTSAVTDTSGIGGYVNAPAGNLTVEAVRTSDGRSVGVGSLTLKAGGISVIRLSARSKQ